VRFLEKLSPAGMLGLPGVIGTFSAMINLGIKAADASMNRHLLALIVPYLLMRFWVYWNWTNVNALPPNR